MTHPTDEELEATAAGVLAQTSWGVPLDAEFAQKTAAMLRACKGRVRVKPLVWEQARDGAGWHPRLTIAYCPVFEKRFYAEHPEKQSKIDAAREARILAALEVERACKGRVKPLVWMECNSGNFKKGECFTARSLVDFAPLAIHKKHDGWWLNKDCKTYDTLEAAKAAAQADYEARIMSALEGDKP